MSEANKQVARRFLDVFETGDISALDDLVLESVVDHNPAPGQRPGRAGVVDAVTMFRTAFPDLRVSIIQQVAEGDFVTQTGTFGGTNTGQFLGAPPTNKSAMVAFMDMYRLENGMLVEAWHVEDIAGMLQQLGLAPAA